MRIALPAVLDPAAIASRDPAAPLVAIEGATMGTMWRVSYARPRHLAEAQVRAAIVARLDGLVAQMSHWDPASLLCAFNRAPAGSRVALPDDFATVIDTALRVAHATGGAFDPAIGRLVDLWGFGPPGARPAPDDRAIASARAAGGWRRLRWDRASKRLSQPGGVALDLSGIAKGYAVDAVADTLGVLGIDHCLVEVGGELVGRGLRPDGDPWWVDLEAPPEVELPPLRVALHQIAVATSGSYVRGDHSLDPRTGRAAVNGVLSVSVIAASAMHADARATAIAILFPNLTGLDAMKLAARIICVENGKVREYLTPQLRSMLAN